ncbi:unnamed protein product, partial [Rotaria sp. Silwood2]
DKATYLKYYEKGKALIISNTNSVCNFGNKDIYIAYYENEFNTIGGFAYIDYNNNNTKESNEPVYPNGYIPEPIPPRCICITTIITSLRLSLILRTTLTTI